MKHNLILTFLAIILVLSPYSIDDSSAQESSAGKVLRYGVQVSQIGKLDPHFAAGSQDRAVADMVFNGLLRFQPGNAPRLEPDLAETIPEFEMIDGHQVWTVTLRKGILFHPGPQTPAYELTADDVIFSLRKSADKQFSTYAGAYTGMTFDKISRYVVTITLEHPLSTTLFLPKLANYAGGFIVSKKAFESMGYEKFSTHPIGTGPFIFKDSSPNGPLVLEANQNYFRGSPKLAGVEMHFLPDINKREAAFLEGNLDIINGSGNKGWLDKMEQQPGVALDTFGVGEVATIYLNISAPPLDDVRVRKAIAYALNRDIFLETTNTRLTGAVYSPVPPQFLPGGITGQEIKKLGLAYEEDLHKSRKLLTEAGFEDGLELDLVASEKRFYRSMYTSMEKQLARVGIRCNIRVVPHSEMHKSIRTTPGPMVIYGAWRPNADAYLTRFFHSDSIVVKGAKPDTNFSHYTKIDKLIEDARLEILPDKQISLWMQAQIRILSEMVAYPVMYSKQIVARNPKIDYGHELITTMALYPQFDERTRIDR